MTVSFSPIGKTSKYVKAMQTALNLHQMDAIIASLARRSVMVQYMKNQYQVIKPVFRLILLAAWYMFGQQAA